MKTLKDQSISYYRAQLERIPAGKAGTYAPQIKITQSVTSGTSQQSVSTNWLGLNNESAQELVNWLQTNFQVSTLEENRHVFKITYGHNAKGNRVVKIFSERFNQRVTISRYYKSPNLTSEQTDNLGDSLAVARQWLIDQGFIIIGKAEGAGGQHDYIISDTFKALKGE